MPDRDQPSRRPRATRVALTALWAVSIAVFFRFWETTLFASGLLLWVLAYGALYVATAALLFGPTVRRQRARVWVPAGLWAAIVAVVLVAYAVLPHVRIAGQVVPTVVFVNVLDVVLPCWIIVRAVLLLWDPWPVRVALLTIGPVTALAAMFAYMVPMPGRSSEGRPPPLTGEQVVVRDRLRAHVDTLATRIGARSESAYQGLLDAADYLRRTLESLGYEVRTQEFAVGGQRFRNLEVELPGARRPEETVVVGAHYDTAMDTPGADDNASGVAGVLELARLLRTATFERTVRLVLFPNEEPPFFETEWMGSAQYAAAAAERGERIEAMLSLETIGYFSDAPGSQRYPPLFRWFYPSRGDFIAFVGNLDSRSLVRRSVAVFRATTALPSEGAAAVAQVPGVGWSDHSAFWKHGYRALMITDTAPFRYRHYHLRTDTIDRLDFDRMTYVVLGVADVVRDLAGGGEAGLE